MAEWWQRDWLPRHVLAAPFGIFLITALLTWWGGAGNWREGATQQAAAQLVDLAAVLYGMAAVTVERGGRLMFWALDQRRQWREKWRAEIVAETEERVRAETEQRVRVETEQRVRVETEERVRLEERNRAEENTRRQAAHLERVAEERGIPLEELLPPAGED